MSALPEQTGTGYVSFTNPLDLELHFIGLELAVYVCFALTLRHALRQHARGDSYHLFQWIALFVYGVIMELVAFNLFQNYAHATFTVQFYHGQLPLYITCVYMVFHYTGIKMIERLALSPIREGLLCGLAIMLIDVPFDSLGVDAGWWAWVDNSATAPHPKFVEAIETRWFGVPVTSYYWYLMYGALLAIFSRGLYAKIEGWAITRRLLMAPVVSVGVVVAGALAFQIMFWTPRSLGASDHIIVATYIAFVLLVALTTRAPNARPPERWLVINTVLWHSFHLALMAWLFSAERLSHGSGKLALIVPASLLSIGALFWLPLRRSRR